MKIIDIVSKIDKTNPKLITEPDFEELASSCFDIHNLYHSDDPRLKCYIIDVHQCTDTWVGTRVYFLDDIFVCISKQKYRKSDTEFYFVSDILAQNVKTYLLSLLDEDPTYYSLLNMDEEIDEYYSVEYISEIILTYHKFGVYIPTNENIEILFQNLRFDFCKNMNFHNIKVKFIDSNIEKIIDVREIKFKKITTY